MKRPRYLPCLLATLFLLHVASSCSASQPSAANVAAFDAYSHKIELRLTNQRSSFLSLSADKLARLHRGELILEDQTPANPPPGLEGALLHHWTGTAFVPGATAAAFEHLLRNINAYPQHFAPELLEAHTLSESPGHMTATMRVRQHHILTVVMDTTYDITFGPGYSTSKSIRIDELDSSGRPLSAADSHGFLWRQNTFWTYEQRDGGLYLQIESLSLTRAIPTGLGWAVRPFLDSVPRESLEFTLHSAATALTERTSR